MEAIKPRYAVVTFISGAKGGVGTSTLSAGFVRYTVERFSDLNVMVIDAGVEGNATLSKLLGFNYRGIVGIYDYLARGQEPNVTNRGRVWYVGPGIMSDHLDEVEYLLKRNLRDPDSIAEAFEYTSKALSSFLNNQAVKRGIGLFVLDIPTSVASAITTWAPLALSGVVNIVSGRGGLHLGEVELLVQRLIQHNIRAVRNIFINASIDPNREPIHEYRQLATGRVFVIPKSDVVSLIVDYGGLDTGEANPIAYCDSQVTSKSRPFRDWCQAVRKAFEEVLASQVIKAISPYRTWGR